MKKMMMKLIVSKWLTRHNRWNSFS